MKLAQVILVTLITVPVIAQDARIEEIDKSPIEAEFSSGGQLNIDLCSSGVELKGIDHSILRVSYHSEGERTRNVKVLLETSGSRARIHITGCPRNNFWLTIEVPKSCNLYVRMFAGELQIRNVTGNKDVRLQAGQLTMDIGESGDYGRVEASVSGELEAPPFNVSKGGLFRSFDHTGPGKYDLHAHVGTGQLELR
jgi:hypothetical protein